MSDKMTDEVENKVTISSEDCNNVKKYCSHFGVPNTPELEAALDKFSGDPSYENQLDVKLEICKWILGCDHESFKDSLWDAPKKAAEEVVFDLQFDKDLKEELTKTEEDENTESN
jgi:hypothetical protein